MREIGGYLELEQLISKEYYPNLIAINTARNALVYIIKARKIKKLYIPYFLCDSIYKVCNREEIVCEFYHVGKDFLPIFDKRLKDGEFLYVVNYYGQICNDLLNKLLLKYERIIFDNVQSFFQKPIEGIDTIYSCRKFFGVPDGAYLSTNIKLEENIKKDYSKGRMKHILGRFEGCASKYYPDFKANDSSFVELELRSMSDLTHNILGAIDYVSVIEKRNANYAVLEEFLGKRNKLKLIWSNGPYCYPFYYENGMLMKKKLAERNIYVATLWPNVVQLEECLEKEYAENILPLPCDQRYNINDMIYMIKEIEKCIS